MRDVFPKKEFEARIDMLPPRRSASVLMFCALRARFVVENRNLTMNKKLFTMH